MKGFFRRSYETGVYGWPKDEPTGQVLEFFDEVIGCHPGGRVLDIGCGEGRHALVFSDRGHPVVALDYEPLAVELARGRAAVATGRAAVVWLVADAFEMPFGPEAFSVAVDYGVFHHIKVPDQASYIEEVRRVLVPGGCLLLSVFSTNFKHEPEEVRRRNWVVHRDHYDRFFTQQEICELFSPAFGVKAVVEEVDGHEAYHHALLVKEAA
jgi:SAM-dependent methyltransferase